jgi:diamine N-acetyltransferase
MLAKDNITLRAPEPEDIDFLFQLENDQRLWHLSNTLTPFSRFDLEQFVMLPDKDIFVAKQARFMIVSELKGNSLLVGTVDLFDFDPLHKRAGIGIVLVESERKKGIAGIALELIIEYAFNLLDLHQLYCNIEESNKDSFTLFEQKGFKLSGIKKDWNRRDGKWVSEHLLQLINSK